MATVTPEEFLRNRAEMESLLASTLKGRPAPVVTTRTPTGHVLDWIPREAQFGGEFQPTPPPPLKHGAADPKRLGKPATPELELPGVQVGPPGTVPFRRPIVDAMSHFQSVAQLDKVKVPRPSSLTVGTGLAGERVQKVMPSAEVSASDPPPPAPDYKGHYYGNSNQSVTNFGGRGSLSCFAPAVSAPNHFSLIQIGCTNNQQGYMQTVEAGWIVYPDIYGGDYTPHLFTFYTTNGYGKQSDYIGGWNTKFKGWYQYDAQFYPGMTFSPLSEVDGPQMEITIQYLLWQGNWWLSVQDVWVGCYPGSLFAVAPPGGTNKVTTNTLGDHADEIGFWGEIYDADNIPPEPQMGSGHFASTGWGWSAYMHGLSYCKDSSGTLADYQGGFGSASDSSLYTIDAEFSATDWMHSHCFVGGPGSFSALPSGPTAAHLQLGLTQTDVVAIDKNGQLCVSWLGSTGGWQGPTPISSKGKFPASAPLAAGPQVSLTQTDVFAIDTSGTLNVSWVAGGGGWNGPAGIGIAMFLPGAPVATSPQFGLNQTDVFAVNKDGALTVSWVEGGGRWNGPATISGVNVFPANTVVAASQQFDLDQTDVFAINKRGALTVSWVERGGAWKGPVSISPPGMFVPGASVAAGQQFGLPQTDVFAVDKDGALTVTWVERGGAWNGPVRISRPEVFLSGAALATSQQFGLTQTDVFGVDRSGTLQVFWVASGGTWNGPGQIGPVGLAIPSAPVSVCQQAGAGATMVFLVDQKGDINVFSVVGGGAWVGPKSV